MEDRIYDLGFKQVFNKYFMHIIQHEDIRGHGVFGRTNRVWELERKEENENVSMISFISTYSVARKWLGDMLLREKGNTKGEEDLGDEDTLSLSCLQYFQPYRPNTPSAIWVREEEQGPS